MYVFGRNVAKELLRNRRKINKVYLVNNFKEDEILKKLPVIVFSSLITDELRHKGESVGADAQLSKPEVEGLVETIDKLLQ